MSAGGLSRYFRRERAYHPWCVYGKCIARMPWTLDVELIRLAVVS